MGAVRLEDKQWYPVRENKTGVTLIENMIGMVNDRQCKITAVQVLFNYYKCGRCRNEHYDVLDCYPKHSTGKNCSGSFQRHPPLDYGYTFILCRIYYFSWHRSQIEETSKVG